MEIREIEAEKLKDDYSNLNDIILPELKKYLADPTGNEVRKKLEEMALAAAQEGVGVPLNQIPEPYLQSGNSCQTMALINGVNSVGGRFYLGRKNINELVNAIRDKAGRDGHPDDAMIWVEQYFPEEGIPLQVIPDASLNPIKLAEVLFKERTFLGLGEGSRYHATVLVPLAKPTKDCFAIELDSLGGKKSVIGVTQYVDRLVSMNPDEDNYRVYQLK